MSEISSMQTTKTPQQPKVTSDDSLLHDSGFSDIESKEYLSFAVEVASEGGDVVYTFRPPGEDSEFYPNFGLALEAGFRSVLPGDVDVRAGYTNLQEAMVHSRVGQGYEGRVVGMQPEGPLIPRESFWVRVIGWADRPLADVFLKDRVFREIQKAVEELP
jgi:hypothetical protein